MTRGWPYEVMRDRVVSATDGLAEAMVELEAARKCLKRALIESCTGVANADRVLRRALGDVSLTRWNALHSGRAYLRTTRDSRDANLARRRRSAVDEALAELRAAEAAGAEGVERAQARLNQATRELKRFGPLAAGIVMSGGM